MREPVTVSLVRVLAAAAAIFVFALAWNGLVHGVLLADAAVKLQGVARAPAERPMALALLITAGVAVLFAYSYAAWRRRTLRAALGHGLFFGVLAGLLAPANQFFVYPIPGELALAWFGFGIVEFIAAGAIAYAVFRRA